MKTHWMNLLVASMLLGCGNTAAAPDADPSECVDCPPECQAEGAELIYTLGEQYVMSSFDPALAEAGEDPFTMLGTLRCNGLVSPLPPLSESWAYSMTSDRYGNLWVFFTSGQLFKVDIETLACTETDWNHDRLTLMALGGPDRHHEKLLMTLVPPGGGMGVYAQVDANTFEIGTEHALADQEGFLPTLSASADGKVFGFRASSGNVGTLEELNVETGEPLESWQVADHGTSTVVFFTASFWGGNHYLFTTVANSLGKRTSRVAVFDTSKPAGEELHYLDTDPTKEISLATSSTCAPATAP